MRYLVLALILIFPATSYATPEERYAECPKPVYYWYKGFWGKKQYRIDKMLWRAYVRHGVGSCPTV